MALAASKRMATKQANKTRQNKSLLGVIETIKEQKNQALTTRQNICKIKTKEDSFEKNQSNAQNEL